MHAVLLLALLVCGALAAQKKSYDDICEEMIEHAQLAAQAHNRGDNNEADRQMAALALAFDKARSLEPNNPQAFAHMATFHHNAHKFDEALDMWTETIKRVRDPQMKAFMEARKKHTLFGRISTIRDRLYQHGQGDVVQAHEYALQQIALYDMPDILFDAGTMEIMLTEINISMNTQARAHMQLAHERLLESYVGGRKKLGHKCTLSLLRYPSEWTFPGGPTSEVLVKADLTPYGTAPPADTSKEDNMLLFRDGSVFIAHLHHVALSGLDGVIVARGPSNCSIFVSTGLYSERLHLNVQQAAIWARDLQGNAHWHDANHGRFPEHGRTLKPVPRVARAVSTIQIASSSFYHLLVEVLGRLMLAYPLLTRDPSLKLILPSICKRTTSFAHKFLQLLPFKVDPSRILYYPTEADVNPDVRVEIDDLYYPTWDAVHIVPRDRVSEPYPGFVPRAVLRQLREAFNPRPAERTRVIFISRAEKTRRLVGESQLVEALQHAIPSHVDFTVYDGGKSSASESIELFSSAHAVIGVHGGALSNILFCQPGTVIIELGFRAPHSRHYAAMSFGLDLAYSLVLLEPQQQGMASATVSVSPDARAAVVTILQEYFASVAAHSEL